MMKSNGWQRLLGPQLGPIILMCLIGFHSLACTCQREEKKQEAKAPSVPKEPELPQGVDKTLLDELKSASKGCELSEARQRMTCNGGEKNALVLSFNKGQRDRMKAIRTLIFAVESSDEKLKAVAAAVLYASFRTSLGPDAAASQVNPQLAQSFLKTALSLPDQLAMQVIPAATHVSTLAGKTKDLVAALGDEVPVQVRTMAYRYLMVYGRLEAFETIRKLGSDPGAAVVLAAIESPRNMRDWTKAEQEAICPWAVQFLDDARSPVVGNAMAVVSHCAGKELDQLLERVQQTLKDKQFSFMHSTALRDICGPAKKRREDGATEQQCERVRTLLEKAASSSDVEGRVRAMCLSTLASTWPDKKTLSLASTLKKESDPDLGRTADQVVTRLDRSLQKSN